LSHCYTTLFANMHLQCAGGVRIARQIVMRLRNAPVGMMQQRGCYGKPAVTELAVAARLITPLATLTNRI